MPLRAEGVSRKKAFLYGAFSGAVEPVGAALTILVAGFVVPLLPYLLSFAAGAMIYVVVEELIPEMSEGKWIRGKTPAIWSWLCQASRGILAAECWRCQ